MNIVYHGERTVRQSASPALLLVLACGAQLMVVLDGLIVTVALPQIRAGLGLSLIAQQWVVDGYLVTLGGLLLLAARAADLLGQRRVFLAGLAVFTLASLAGGLAGNGAVLLAARAVQGVGAAALAPSSLSLLMVSHPGERRTRALSVWSATAGSAGALGLVLGGVVTDTLGWRWVLLINVPIGVLLWALAAAVLVPLRPTRERSFDLAGAVTVTSGIGALVFGVARVGEDGWGSRPVLLSLAAAVVLLAMFVAAERRAVTPLVPLDVVTRAPLPLVNLMMASLGVIMTATLVFLSLYQQRVLGQSPLRTGLALLPMSVVLTVGALASKSLLPRFDARRLIVVGAVTMAAGSAWMATIPVHSAYVLHLLGPTAVWAAGSGIVTMPCVSVATSGLAPEFAGLASGLVNTARQAGGAIGLAALTSVAASVSAHAGGSDPAARVVAGYRAALLLAAGLALVVAALATRLDRT